MRYAHAQLEDSDGEYLRKRTTLRGETEILKRRSAMCDGNHQRTHVFGLQKVHGRWTNISSFVRAYKTIPSQGLWWDRPGFSTCKQLTYYAFVAILDCT